MIDCQMAKVIGKLNSSIIINGSQPQHDRAAPTAENRDENAD